MEMTNQCGLSTKDFIRRILAEQEKKLEGKYAERLAIAEVRSFKAGKQELVEEIIEKAVMSLEDVYGGLRKYREPDIINAFRERFKQNLQ